MEIKFKIDARCPNCKHWVYADEQEEYLDIDKTYCGLTNELKQVDSECENLEFLIDTLEFSCSEAEVIK